MRLAVDGATFDDVRIPILWGSRAIVVDDMKRVSVIDLSGQAARLEILSNEVAPGTRFSPLTDGVKVLDSAGRPLYTFSSRDLRLTSESLGLPEIQLGSSLIRVGTGTYQEIHVSGSEVGMIVDAENILLGAPAPPGLAALAV